MLLLVVAFLIGLAAWWLLFRLDRDRLWERSLLIGVGLIAVAVAVQAVDGQAGRLIGPLRVVEVALGLAVGAAYVVATQLGNQVLCRILPRFTAEVGDLYRIKSGTSRVLVVASLLVMSVAEEVFWRGMFQARAGLVLAVVAYAAVQVVERKLALVIAAVLGGVVWGGLLAWRGGLVAPTVAHTVWTVTLCLVWPLKTCATDHQGARRLDAVVGADIPADRSTASAPATPPV